MLNAVLSFIACAEHVLHGGLVDRAVEGPLRDRSLRGLAVGTLIVTKLTPLLVCDRAAALVEGNKVGHYH